MSGRESMRTFANPALLVGLVAVATLLVIGVFGTSLAPYNPNAGASTVIHELPDGTRSIEVPPTLPDAEHWLGTDALGRDQWSRILAGAWLTLAVVLGSAAVRLGFGIALGLSSGWFGGTYALAVGVVVKGVAAVPQLLLAILLVLVTRPLGVAGFIASLALVGWPEVTEFLQAEAQRARAQPFIEAARSVGARERRLLRTHVLTSVAPQLLTVAALEIGAVLLLLAELGIVGLFIAGATFLVGDFGPLGVSGRVPEWGQMLGAIQFYAITDQLSTLLPAVFVVLAAAAFAVLADGLRAASDPHSSRSLRPATFGVLTKVLVGALCFSAVGFIGVNVRISPLTMDEGRALAEKTAQQAWPGSAFVAGVARYIVAPTTPAPPNGFERPNRLTYYYRNDKNEVLRISYLNADRLAVEVRPYESEDELDIASLRPLPASLTSYALPATTANSDGGGRLRADLGAQLVRAIVVWPSTRAAPTYTVTIGTLRLLTLRRYCCFDALTGAPDRDAQWLPL